MEKLFRFSLLAFFYVVLLICFYSVIPTITWIFGGSFIEVAQHPVYVMFAGLFFLVMLGVIFGECFDSEFNTKEKY
jgi:hypothetical protein